MQHISHTHAFRQRDQNLKLVGADPFTQSGWTGVPNVVLRHPDLSLGARMTYAMLLYYAREEHSCFPGQATLARDLGVSDRSIRTWLNELKRAGLVNWQRRGLGKPNLYEVYVKASFWSKPREK